MPGTFFHPYSGFHDTCTGGGVKQEAENLPSRAQGPPESGGRHFADPGGGPSYYGIFEALITSPPAIVARARKV